MEDVQRLKQIAYQSFGEVAVLMNNAGIGNGGGPFENYERWQRVLSVNLWGVINGAHAFAQAMAAQGTPAAIVNTGSKQGITCPPGDTAYNVSKAGVKVLTEGLAHSLRSIAGCKVTAHLLIPGHVWTGITGRKAGRSRPATSRRAPGRRSRPSISCWSGWATATSTSSARTTTCRTRSTRAASSGPPTTSSRTARRCRAGTPNSRTSSRPM